MEKPLKSLQDIDTNMSIKVHFLHCHLDKFLDNCGYVRGQFNLDIETM